MSCNDETLLAPDVGIIVEYSLGGRGVDPATYRVDGWMRAAPAPKNHPNILSKILFETCREFDTEDGKGERRMQWCLREEATHLSLSGVCGAIAPIKHCKVVGRVNWSEADINESRSWAVSIGETHEILF